MILRNFPSGKARRRATDRLLRVSCAAALQPTSSLFCPLPSHVQHPATCAYTEERQVRQLYPARTHQIVRLPLSAKSITRSIMHPATCERGPTCKTFLQDSCVVCYLLSYYILKMKISVSSNLFKQKNK